MQEERALFLEKCSAGGIEGECAEEKRECAEEGESRGDELGPKPAREALATTAIFQVRACAELRRN